MILCIESSTEVCSCAIAHLGSIYYEESDRLNDHASSLMPIILKACNQAGVILKDLEAVAIASGPGSFTALRIGAATAKGICLPLGIPLIAIPTLEIIEYALMTEYPDADYYLSALDARREEVYLRISNKTELKIEMEPHIYNSESFKSYEGIKVIGGNGSQKAKMHLDPLTEITYSNILRSEARMMVKIAQAKFEISNFVDLMAFSPNYGKPVKITQSTKKWV